MRTVFSSIWAQVVSLFFLSCAGLASATPLQASDHQLGKPQIVEFLQVTGFDEALNSIAFSAGQAPSIIGMDARSYGASWDRFTKEIFDPAHMRDTAIGILQDQLSPDAMKFAMDFYGSPLGQDLVRAENAAHSVVDSEVSLEAGMRIVSLLVRDSDPKLALLRRMGQAVDAGGVAVQAIQDVQLRFVFAAVDAGLITLQVDPSKLREEFTADQVSLRLALAESALAQNAYTYQGFTLAELTDYAAALEHPLMQTVYALLNAVQYEIQAERFEALAVRMAEYESGEDL